MRFITLLFLTCVFSYATETKVIDGRSPMGDVELIVIPAFETDPPNETPYRVALKDRKSNSILDSFLWNGDMGDANAHKETKAYWSPKGDFLAVYIRAGRLLSYTKYFILIDRKLVSVTPPDAWQNVLGRFKTTQFGPNGGISPIKWIDESRLSIAIWGSADTKEGRFPFDYNGVLKFSGSRQSTPFIRLEEVKPSVTKK